MEVHYDKNYTEIPKFSQFSLMENRKFCKGQLLEPCTCAPTKVETLPQRSFQTYDVQHHKGKVLVS